MKQIAIIGAAAVIAACSGSEAPKPAPAVPVDAPPIDGITTIGAFDPASGMHLDEDVGSGSARAGSGAKPANGKPRAGRPIEITLRSSPGGATAWVDGAELGPTPAFWQGEANGKEHEFAFTLRGHFSARYRFVPVTSGVVHARLERNGTDDNAPAQLPPAPVAVPSAPPPAKLAPDAAPAVVVAPVPPPPPPPAVDAAPPVAPPPTLIAPADGPPGD